MGGAEGGGLLPVLAALGVRRDPCGGAWVVPSETTIRRALADTGPAKTGNVRTPSPWVRSSSAADT
jgi:hypothetical protein